MTNYTHRCGRDKADSDAFMLRYHTPPPGGDTSCCVMVLYLNAESERLFLIQSVTTQG